MKKSWMTRISILLLLSLSIFQLTSCHPTGVGAYMENPVVSNLPKQNRELLLYIEKSGIQVIKQGMRFTFVIPTDCFFEKDTRRLKSHRYYDLDKLAQFIREYTDYFQHPHISIAGYTDKTWFAPARDKLSRHYANIIAGVLVEDGVDPGMMHVKGAGAKHPIASNHYPMGTAFNRRVEIVIH